MVEQYGGLVRIEPRLSKEELVASDPENPTATDTPRVFTLARLKYLGIYLMCGAELAWYIKLLEELQNDFMKGKDNYPEDMMEAIFLRMKYKQTHRNKPAQIYNDSEWIAFVQDSRRPPLLNK